MDDNQLLIAILDALTPLIQEHGQSTVINAIHTYFHQGQPNVR